MFTPWGDVMDLQVNAGLYINIVVFHILYLKSECPEIKKEETEKHFELGHQKKKGKILTFCRAHLLMSGESLLCLRIHLVHYCLMFKVDFHDFHRLLLS